MNCGIKKEERKGGKNIFQYLNGLIGLSAFNRGQGSHF